MGVDRMILLLAVIRIVENQIGPQKVDGSPCEGSNWKYVFVLNSTGKEINVLTDLVKSARSAVVRRSEIVDRFTEVDVSPEDFTEFRKKSEASRLYRSHSLQCRNPFNDSAIVKNSTNRSEPMTTELINGTAMNVSTTMDFVRKSWKILDDRGFKSTENSTIKLSSNSFEKSFKPSETIFSGSAISRSSRNSKITSKLQKKKISKQKSNHKQIRKIVKSKNLQKGRKYEKSAVKSGGQRTGKTFGNTIKSNTGKKNKKTNFVPKRRTSTQEPWNRLMIMAKKSLTKSNDSSAKSNRDKKSKTSSMALDKLSYSARSKNAERAKFSTKNSASVTKKSKLPITAKSSMNPSKSDKNRNRAAKKQTSLSNSRTTKIISNISKPMFRKTSSKTIRERNRNTREIKISAEIGKICNPGNFQNIETLIGDRSKRDFTFSLPIACTVIKISNPCDYDCPEDEDGIKFSSETVGKNDSMKISNDSSDDYSSPRPEHAFPVAPLDSSESPETPSGESLPRPSGDDDGGQADGLPDLERISATLNSSDTFEDGEPMKNGDEERPDTSESFPNEDDSSSIEIAATTVRPNYPIPSETRLRQPLLIYGDNWRGRHPSELTHGSSLTMSDEGLENSAMAKNGLRLPVNFNDEPFAVGRIPDDGEIDDADYDDEDDEDGFEKYAKGFNGGVDNETNGLGVSAWPVQPQMSGNQKFHGFSLNKSKMDGVGDSDGEIDYGDEDYEDTDGDYDVDDDNDDGEDYVFENN